MALWLLLVVAFVVVIGITLMFVLSTNKAYSHKHTIDPVPQKSMTDDENI